MHRINNFFVNKYYTTPESIALSNRLKSINTYIKLSTANRLKKYETTILNYYNTNQHNIFVHMHKILLDFINKKLTTNCEEYYNIMKCGSILLDIYHNDTSNISDMGKVNYLQIKNIIALFLLNYISCRLLTYSYKKEYIYDLDEYIKSNYRDMRDEYMSQFIQLYSNLKKIIYVKKYPYSVNAEIYSILLEYYARNEYNITDIPASDIISDVILSDNELSEYDVLEHEIDSMFKYINRVNRTRTYATYASEAIVNTESNDAAYDDIIVDDNESHEINSQLSYDVESDDTEIESEGTEIE